MPSFLTSSTADSGCRLMTIISSGWQQLAFIMPSIRAEAILPNPRNPKVMCEREVIRLLAGCKGGEVASGGMGELADWRMGVWACSWGGRRWVLGAHRS